MPVSGVGDNGDFVVGVLKGRLVAFGVAFREGARWELPWLQAARVR